jgi:hypothetical protein
MVLRLDRYGVQGEAIPVRRLVLSWADVRGGLYMWSAVPYRTRTYLDSRGQLVSRLALLRPATVVVDRDTAPGQVALAVDPPSRIAGGLEGVDGTGSTR